MEKPKKIIAILIAYNAAGTLRQFYSSFPRHLVDELVLVDDASKDGTFELAKELGINAYQNRVNLGYGGNMKEAIRIALEGGADVIIDIHPDGEYNPSAIPAALKAVENGADLVLGNRFYDAKAPLSSGMRVWKFFPIMALNKIAQVVLGVKIHDLHQGFRVYTRKLLEKINYKNDSNGYIFSFELIAQAAFNKCSIAEVPVDTNYTGVKRGASLKHSLKYSFGIFKVMFFFLLAKSFYRTSMYERKFT